MQNSPIRDGADRHEQRNEPAAADAADHLAAVVEHARDAVAHQPVEIVLDGAMALRREQVEEAAVGDLVRFLAEQRLGAAVARRDHAVAIDHDDAVGRRLQDRFELAPRRFGLAHGELGVAQPLLCGRQRRVGGGDARAGLAQRLLDGAHALLAFAAREHDEERGRAVPGDREQPAFDRHRGTAPRGDGELLSRAAGLAQGCQARLGEQALEAAGFGDRLDILVAGPFEQGPIGMQELVAAVDQHADRDAIEHRAFAVAAGRRAVERAAARRIGAGNRARPDAMRRLRLRCLLAWLLADRLRRGLGGGVVVPGRGRVLARRAFEPRAERPGDLLEGVALDRRQHRPLVGRGRQRRPERHDVLRRRHHGELGTRLGGRCGGTLCLRLRGRRRLGYGLGGWGAGFRRIDLRGLARRVGGLLGRRDVVGACRHIRCRRHGVRGRSRRASRRDDRIQSRQLAAHPEAAIAAERALAVEHRQARHFDRQPLGHAGDRPGERNAAERVARGEHRSKLALGIEVEGARDLRPRSPQHRGDAVAHHRDEIRRRDGEAAVGIDLPYEAQRMTSLRNGFGLRLRRCNRRGRDGRLWRRDRRGLWRRRPAPHRAQRARPAPPRAAAGRAVRQSPRPRRPARSDVPSPASRRRARRPASSVRSALRPRQEAAPARRPVPAVARASPGGRRRCRRPCVAASASPRRSRRTPRPARARSLRGPRHRPPRATKRRPVARSPAVSQTAKRRRARTPQTVRRSPRAGGAPVRRATNSVRPVRSRRRGSRGSRPPARGASSCRSRGARRPRRIP